MKDDFVKYDKAITLLNSGWEIFTQRGSAPWRPVYYHLYKDGDDRKSIHFQTIEKLIREKIINGTDSPSGSKYKLI